MKGRTLRERLNQHHADVKEGIVDDRWVLPLPVLQPDSPDLNQYDDVIPIRVHPRWAWWGYTRRATRGAQPPL